MFHCVRCDALNYPFGTDKTRLPFAAQVECRECGSRQSITWLNSYYETKAKAIGSGSVKAEELGTKD